MTDSNLDDLSKYFFGGEAEAESEIRNDIFVSPKDLKSVLSFRRARYKVLLGSKGLGKSLLINVLNESILEDESISVLLAPEDFNCEEIASKSTNSDKIRVAYAQLLRAIGAKIGTHIENGCINTSKVNLKKLAITEGTTKPDFISKFGRFLTDAVPITKEIAKAALNSQNLNTNNKILKEDIKFILEQNKEKFWVLIDDVDNAAIFKDERYDYSVCWAIVCAAIDIANDFGSIRSLISVRTDIWHTMTVAKKLGSDRLDKIQRPIYLKFKESEIEAMLERRLSLASKTAINQSSPKDNFFKKKSLTLPGEKGIERNWETWIAKMSRNKPRDMVQLVQELIESAHENDREKIEDKHAYKVMLPYAEQRIKNIQTEYREICPQIKAIIDDISNKTIYTFEGIIDTLKKLPSTRTTIVDGKALTPNSKESAIKILNILYMANFINAKRDLSGLNTDDNYEHILFSSKPDLVTLDHWNELSSYKWEIHPVFHAVIQNRVRLHKGPKTDIDVFLNT